MSIQTIAVVAGNTAPTTPISCQRNNVAIDLTGVQAVYVIVSSKQTGLVTNTGHQVAVVSGAPTAGNIVYSQQAADFPVAGTYICDVAVDYGAGKHEVLLDQLKVKARAPIQPYPWN